MLERLKFFAENESRLQKLEKLRCFLVSKPYMFILLLLACVITVTGAETAGLFIFTAIIVINLIISDDTISSTLPFLLVSEIMIKCFDSFGTYGKLAPLAIPIVILLIAHFVIYKKPLKTGSSIWSVIAITVAITLGGLGSISAEEYFSLTSLFYVAGLGIGMLISYVIVYSYFDKSDRTDIHRTFAYIMFIMGLFACLMVILHYAVNMEKVFENHSILEPQWRNNVSTFIILAMPFPFYLSIKKYIYIIPALITMPCLVLTSSRGGLLFGAVEFMLCCIYIIYADKKHRKITLAIFALCGLGAILCSGDIITFISKTLSRFNASAISDDPRAGFIRRAIEDYKTCPVFGRGIGYMGNRDIYPSKDFAANWYHSAPFQVIGSFGTVGVIAYVWQFIRRNRIFWSHVTYFRMAVYISYIGLFMMSLVNPGEFCPVPYEFLAVMMFALIERNCGVSNEKVLAGKNLTKAESKK